MSSGRSHEPASTQLASSAWSGTSATSCRMKLAQQSPVRKSCLAPQEAAHVWQHNVAAAEARLSKARRMTQSRLSNPVLQIGATLICSAYSVQAAEALSGSMHPRLSPMDKTMQSVFLRRRALWTLAILFTILSILMLLSIFSSIFLLLRVRATLLSATVITVPVTCRESIALQMVQLAYAYIPQDHQISQETDLPLTFQSAHAHEEQGRMHACIIAA